MGALLIAGLVAAVVAAGISIYIYYGRLYMQSRVYGAGVEFRRMFRMTASGISAFRVVTAYTNAKRAGFDIPLDRFEDYARAGGDPREVTRKLQAADRSDAGSTVESAFAARDTSST